MESTDVRRPRHDPVLSDAMLSAAILRAGEAESDCPLFTDPYAHLFVDAAVQRCWHAPPADPTQCSRAVEGYAASRTRWFDEFFLAAGANGIDQAVIFSAGLDARAWRLPWVDGSIVYEIDRPKLLAFKAETLRRQDTSPGARYVPVPIDLRDDWPEALRTAGFDAGEPTAWAAEDLLTHLSEPERTLLLERIGELSARGSRVGVEALDTDLLADHTAVPDWLGVHGWAVTCVGAIDLMDRYGRCAAGKADETTPRTVFVEGQLTC